MEREEISASEREGWVHINWRISDGNSKRDMRLSLEARGFRILVPNTSGNSGLVLGTRLQACRDEMVPSLNLVYSLGPRTPQCST
uniref:Uncharacterized protein n=1 Tax=Amphimedon queenslandica TaxID=400682 RepID=A0A1X7TR74_AMPQE